MDVLPSVANVVQRYVASACSKILQAMLIPTLPDVLVNPTLVHPLTLLNYGILYVEKTTGPRSYKPFARFHPKKLAPLCSPLSLATSLTIKFT